MKKKGIIFIISSPSGVGKTTVANRIITSETNIKRSISFTTRAPRANERDGVDYFFIKKEEFSQACKQERMLEHAKVFTNYYGTCKTYVENLIEEGIDVLCCIDWQGALQIAQKTTVVTVFLLPPSMCELKNRLFKRGTDDKEAINYRLTNAAAEIKQFQIYDYVLINDKLEETIATIKAIIKTERAKLVRNIEDISQHITDLLQEKW